jgi:hypothetical protein
LRLAAAFEGTERFQVLRQIGVGGMGVVYEAYDRERHCHVALKTLRTLQPRAILRLKHEFRALRDLQHRNLVSFGELLESAGHWFFTMELVSGVDLLQWVREPTPERESPAKNRRPTQDDTVVGPPNLSERLLPDHPAKPPGFDTWRLREGLRQLARGLVALHDAGMVHRDIKPSNILVTSEPRVVLLDFGVVADLFRDAREADHEVAGTLAFMAPEQTTGRLIGPPADWYAVGVLLYLAMTGGLPIPGEGEVLLELKRTLEPSPPRLFAPGVPPDLDRLCMDLLEIDPARRPDGRELLRRLGAEEVPPQGGVTLSGAAPFVGRELELGELHRAFEESSAGRAVAILVQGESGVGKSTLVQRFADELVREGEGTVVLTGRCYERESIPYRAIDEIVDGLSQHLRRLPEIEAAALLPRMASLLAQAFPVLLDVELFAAAPRGYNVADPHELRACVFGALRELLARFGDRRRVVLVIDDLQWADADSLALLADVLSPPMAPRLLLIATVRSGSQPTASQRSLDDWVQRLGDVRHVRLENLPLAEARQLASLLVRAPRGHASVDADAIAAESEGHPLFIDTLVRRRLAHGDDASRLGLEEVLWERVKALGLVERKILELVAVAGRPLLQGVVARAAGLDIGELGDIAANLRRANFVRTDGVRSTDMIEPYHDRVRTAIRHNLPAERLLHCHERLASAMEASGGQDPEALAVHWEGAGDLRRAAEYTIVAAARAAKALAFDRAAQLYGTALTMHPLEAPKEREIRTFLAEALINAGRSAEAAEAFRMAAALSTGSNVLELTQRVAEQLLISGRIDEGLAEARTVLAALGLRMPTTPRRAAVSLLLRRARIRMRGVRFRERAADELAPTTLRLIDLTFSLSQGLIWVDVIRGAEFQSRHVLLALRAGEPYRLARALAIEAGFAATSGGRGPRRATHLLELAQALADKTANPHALGFVLGASGFAALAQGRWREARDLNQAAEKIFTERCTGAPWELAFVRTNMLWGMSLLGTLGELANRGYKYAQAAQGRGDRFARTSMICGPLSIAFLAEDDPVRARGEIDEAMAQWSQEGFHLQHVYALAARCNVDLYMGRPEEAYRRLLETWPLLRRSYMLHFQIVRILAAEVRGRVALALAAVSGGSEKKRLLGEASRLARRLEAERLPFCGAMAKLFLAECSLRRGEVESASTLLSDAALAFDAAEMLVYAASTRRQLGQLAGGEEGRTQVAVADQQLVELGTRNPARLAVVYAPGVRE